MKTHRKTPVMGAYFSKVVGERSLTLLEWGSTMVGTALEQLGHCFIGFG